MVHLKISVAEPDYHMLRTVRLLRLEAKRAAERCTFHNSGSVPGKCKTHYEQTRLKY